MIENFYKADSLAQQTALEGIKILKDSDKLSFLLEIKNLLPIKNLRADFSFSSDAKQALLSFRTVNPSFIKTIPDMSLYYLSSFGKFHYRSSLLLALAEKLHEKIAQHFLELTIRKKGHLSPSFSQEMFETCDIYIKKLQQSRFNQLQNFYAAHVR